MNVQTIIKTATDCGIALTELERADIERAYDFAEQSHRGQLRKSGEPYFNHVFATAINCAKFGMDSCCIIAGLLHDTVEDTDVTSSDIEQQFGTEIMNLVEGVTKLGSVKYQGNERYVESLRKFLVSVTLDMRVMVVKIADRLHNLQTLEHVQPEKQKRIALESIEIYAPLASRLGMGKLAAIVQDSAFPYAFPVEYKKTKQILDHWVKNQESTLDRVYRGIVKDLGIANIRVIKIDKRIKSLYSLYKKLQRKNWEVESVHDVIALRVIPATVDDCYRILGLVHSHYKPVPGRIKDYIAFPKPNGYQSLHTSVFAGDGNIAEIQIRTLEMNVYANYGVASHHIYKQSSENTGHSRESFNWMQDLSELHSKDLNQSDFIKTLRTDFFSDRIFVCTPKGDIIDLPDGSNVLDFAYAIHGDIGNHASGANINGKFSSLKTELHTNDIVQIITDKKTIPNSKWISIATTNQAKHHIRTYIAKNRPKGILSGLFNYN